MVTGNPALSRRLIEDVMHDIDLAYAEEWKFDHGIMVPLHFLTPRYDLPVIPVNINCQGPPLIPLHRCYAFGRALRRACDSAPERIAVIAALNISHELLTTSRQADADAVAAADLQRLISKIDLTLDKSQSL